MLVHLKEKLKEIRNELFNHPIYAQIDSQKDIHTFMEGHVFAVWDFMNLVKRLQQDITCTQIPWLPVKNPSLARFINEINLGEESDVGFNGEAISHLSLYVNAMDEVGANTSPIKTFLSHVEKTGDVNQALEVAKTPQFVKDFVKSTMNIVLTGSTLDVATYFLVGREDPIPTMFQRILDNWSKEQDAPQFIYYLERHIEVDSGEHGPAAEKMLKILLQEKNQDIDSVLPIATQAIQNRISLWNGILSHLHSKIASTATS